MTDPILDPAMNPDVPPVGPRDWVATLPGQHFRIARVGQVYFDARDGWLMNLSMYAASGERLGRVSPTEGGPGGFEPAIAFKDGWRRIEEPRFPLQETHDGEPRQDGEGRWWTPLTYSCHPAVKTRPLRGKPRAVKVGSPASPPPVRQSDYDPKFEIAQRNMTVQNLRDIRREMTGPDDIALITLRIVSLEREIEAIEAEYGDKAKRGVSR